jgi:hypothetical protein
MTQEVAYNYVGAFEAIPSYVLLSFLSIIEFDVIDFILCLPKSKIINRSCKLKLQVGVLLLNDVINDDVPRFFLEHIMNMVSNFLELWK